MIGKLNLVWWLFVLGYGLLFAVDLRAYEIIKVKDDVRILIDVSSNMTKKDRDNLRLVALRAFAKAVPDARQSNFWVFDRLAWQVPLPELLSSLYIGSENADLSTALGQIVTGWSELSKLSKHRRHIFLFTDGNINLYHNEWMNEEMSKNILDNTVNALRKVGAKVHSFSLFAGSNEELLQDIATATGGRFYPMVSAAKLQEIIYAMFNYVEKLDLAGGDDVTKEKLAVKKNTEEINLLIARRADTKNMLLHLQTPNTVLSHDSKLPEQVKWVSNKLGEFITIIKPQPGDWVVSGLYNKEDLYYWPQLSIDATKLPTTVYGGESIVLASRLMNKKENINNKVLLDNVAVTTKATVGNLPTELYVHNYDSKWYNSQEITMPRIDKAVKVKFSSTAKGLTFSKLLEQSITLEPYPMLLQVLFVVASNGEQTLKVIAVPDAEVLQSQITLQAVVTNELGKTTEYDFVKNEDDKWQFVLTPVFQEGKYELVVKTTGQTKSGRELALASQVLPITIPTVTLPEPIIKEKIKYVEIIKQVPTAELNMDNEVKLSVTQWVVVVVLFILVNIILITLGYFIFKIAKKRNEDFLNNEIL